ncbi:hypothetical protein WH52_11850 [Tenacibaculum holothuriorum]|uniref:PS-10 peptidase S37 n=1 Tax=Tenacibaculum holothuriorum TaxID=1635173 RepID=A0A1Y2PA56_9FLAO|nr:S28 family serine protease [Tenacibaculum holothuriorum]OSY87334.1 hypothetical protein WH52_11850 [Tenacibaculum holothuriorum]
MQRFSYSLLLLFLISCKTNYKTFEELSLKAKLEVLFPKSEVTSIQTNDHFKEAYQVVLEQNLNPKNKEEGTFKHYMYINNVDYKNPTVLITDGYASRNRTTELSKLLKANQVIVEYRMYGKSRPDSIPWKYLTNDNAIEDYHSIVSKLKKIYTGKWLSSGISKGGETTLIYKSKYPEDVDVAVPYVAPLINGLEDTRTNELINSVGTEECRNNIKKFQRAVLENRKAILKLLSDYAEEKKMSFTEVPQEEALEYSVLELPFSFWQWGGKCEEIPNEKASVQELFNYLEKVSGFGLYNDNGFNYYLPSFYQHIKELGYYGFDLEPVKDLLKVVKRSSNDRFAPKNTDLTYDANYIKKVREFIENKGNKILYINGAYDPWGACAPIPKPNVDALKMTLAKGSHATRIKDFSKEDQQKIYKTLQRWLGDEVKIYPLYKN